MNLSPTSADRDDEFQAPEVLDALVLGLGPAGLFTLFQLGLLGVRAAGLDCLPAVGGQCASLYPDKPIYDLPGLPASSGDDLSARLLLQIQPFGQALHLGRQVMRLAQSASDGQSPAHWLLLDDQGRTHAARCLVLGAGAGALLPRLPRLEGLNLLQAPPHQGALATRLPADGSPLLATHRRIVILGDEDEALQAAVTLSRSHEVLHLHRRAQFRASEDSLSAWRAALAEGRLRFEAGLPLAVRAQDGGLSLAWESLTGDTHLQPLDLLLPLLGQVPHWAAVDQLGLDVQLSGKAVHVDAASMRVTGRESHDPLPLYAVGDVADYPGKRKLIVCAFHEATLAAYDIAERLGLRQGPLLFTSSSKVLQARLGVSPQD